MGNLRLAGQLLGYPQLAALAGLAYGVPAAIAHLHGRSAGYANPQHSGIPGMAGYTVGAGLLGGPLSGALTGLAYKTGQGAGRQAATDYMVGPGVLNAGDIQWERPAYLQPNGSISL